MVDQKIKTNKNGEVKKAKLSFEIGDKKIVLKMKKEDGVLKEKVFINGEMITELEFPFVPDEKLFAALTIEEMTIVGSKTNELFILENGTLKVRDEVESKEEASKDYGLALLIQNACELQERLNVSTNGENWRSGVSKNGKTINWYRCIYMETAELIDSFPWKHWKGVDAKADIENAKVEIVDLYHFILSQLLKHYSTTAIEMIMLEANKTVKERSLIDENNLLLPELLMEKALRCSIYRARDAETKEDIREITLLFVELVFSFFKDLEELHTLYFAKNALNEVRQENGYKEGTYKKMWTLDDEKVEDNVVMVKIAKEYSSFEDIKNQLQLFYENMISEQTENKSKDLGKINRPSSLHDLAYEISSETGKKINVGHIKQKMKKFDMNMGDDFSIDLLLDSDIQKIKYSFK